MSIDPVGPVGPDDPGSDAAGIAEAVRQNAARLGLTWRRLPGTVTQSTGPGECYIQMDGDDSTVAPVKAMSLVGPLRAGERVMTDFVPPQGIYVVGRYGTIGKLPYVDFTSANTGVGEASFTPLDIANGSTLHDNAGFFTAGDGALHLPFTGLYDIDLRIFVGTSVPAASFGTILAYALIGATAVVDMETPPSGGGHDSVVNASAKFVANAGDLLDMGVYQVSGAARTCNGRIRMTYLGGV